MAAVRCIKACKHGQDELGKCKMSIRMVIVHDFRHCIVVGARQAGLSMLEAADILGVSDKTISWVYRECSEKKKIFSEWQFCKQKCLVDARDQRRMPSQYKLIERQLK